MVNHTPRGAPSKNCFSCLKAPAAIRRSRKRRSQLFRTPFPIKSPRACQHGSCLKDKPFAEHFRPPGSDCLPAHPGRRCVGRNHHGATRQG